MTYFHQLLKSFEDTHGAVVTYMTAGTSAGIGIWFQNHWLMALSGVAVCIRIGIDIPRLINIL